MVIGALAIVQIVRYRNALAREAYERRYPIVSSAADARAIAAVLGRWRLSAVRAAVAAPPSLETLELLDPCDVPTSSLFRYRAGDVERVTDIAMIPIEEARRGRYMTESDRRWVMAQLGLPILVTSGSGIAYLFDIDGTLLCAGPFDAASPEIVDPEEQTAIATGLRRVATHRK
jgi:hypothetical protein